MPESKPDDDRTEQERYNDRRRLMGTYNPDTWNPDGTPDAGSVNLDVSGTVGPDYLGQETVDVDGHPHDRPTDMDRDHARRLALRGQFDDLDADAPLPLLASDMRADPCEGVQGSYSVVTRLEEPCPECGGDYGILSRHTLAGVAAETCLLCDHTITQA